jgi:hypothetical protein
MSSYSIVSIPCIETRKVVQFKVEYSVYVYLRQLENKLIKLGEELPHPELRCTKDKGDK